MKAVIITTVAARSLRRHRSEAARIVEKINRYAQSGAGDVTQLVGSTAKRLRVGDYRVIFEETDSTITVTDIGPRGAIYG